MARDKEWKFNTEVLQGHIWSIPQEVQEPPSELAKFNYVYATPAFQLIMENGIPIINQK